MVDLSKKSNVKWNTLAHLTIVRKLSLQWSLLATLMLACSDRNDFPRPIWSVQKVLHFTLLIEAVAQRCSLRKLFLEISQNYEENTCTRVSFLIKLQAVPATLLKKRLCHRCFPVNFAKFLRTRFLKITSGGCFCTHPIITCKKTRQHVKEIL